MKIKLPLLTFGLFNLLLSACTTLPARANASTNPSWKWQGFEVIGNHKVPSNEIKALVPIHTGDLYDENSDLWKQWCADIKTKFKFASTNCSSLRYANFEAYFIIDVVEPGSEYRDQFRKVPQKSIPLANQEILDTYEKLYKRLWELFNKGTPSSENADQGYLDYSDSEMHGYVQQLTQTVPAYRINLLDVLANDQDINKREKAANLLNWSMKDLADSIFRSNQLLDDPSSLVRNNISRFTLHFTDKLQNAKDRHQVIDNLLVQLDRPSFADRNKSIYNLLLIAKKFASDRPYIKAKGESLIQYISKASVLPNVKDPATELLKLVNESIQPEIVHFPSGALTLGGELYRPKGDGPFPAVLYNHGSAAGMASDAASSAMGPLYAAKGWIYFMPYRRGQGLSADAGPYIGDLIDAAEKQGGHDAAVKTMIQLLTGDHLNDQLAALAWLKSQNFVQSERIAVAGQSFGGIETVLGAKSYPFCAAVDASGGAMSWDEAPELHLLMKDSAVASKSPMFFFQAENDFTLAPSHELYDAMVAARKTAQIKIYPPYGTTHFDGHSFTWLGSAIWFDDVFGFLQKHCEN